MTSVSFHETLNFVPATVLAPGEYNYIGAFKPELANYIVSFLSTKIKADMLSYRAVIQAFLQSLPKSHSLWFTIRITTPGHEFDTPRWHRDGRMWRVGTPARKYAVTLLGPPTRLLNETENVTRATAARYYEPRREELAELLAGETLINVPDCQIISFTCGTDTSAVHSEPKMNTDRIFMSAVPGTESQLRDLATIRSAVYTP